MCGNGPLLRERVNEIPASKYANLSKQEKEYMGTRPSPMMWISKKKKAIHEVKTGNPKNPNPNPNPNRKKGRKEHSIFPSF